MILYAIHVAIFVGIVFTEKMAPLTKDLTAKFGEKYGSIRCSKLLCDQQVPCADYISYAAELAQDIIAARCIAPGSR